MSPNSNGPIGIPAPDFIAASISREEAMFSSSAKHASLSTGIRRRFTTNAGDSRTRMGTSGYRWLRNPSRKPTVSATTSSRVSTPPATSTSGSV